MAPSNPTFQYHYALALEWAGSRDRARRVLLEVLADQQTFPEREQVEAMIEQLRCIGRAQAPGARPVSYTHL